jgi:midasin
MLDYVKEIFSGISFKSSMTSTNKSNSKLLVILSDGRGVFYEGIEKVKNSIRNAVKNDIFIVFVILDNLGKGPSVYDIKMPLFDPKSNVSVN